MALRAAKPTKELKRLKALFYGHAGAGKTIAAINFPKPYLIDTEKGSVNDQYVDLLNERGGAVFHTADFDEMINELKSLLTTNHEYKTLIIDPLTVPYSNLLDKAEKEVGTEFGRHYGEANKHMKKLLNLLIRLDMNVIITSHAKAVYGDKMEVLGNTFDCYKKLDYLFDLVFEVQKRGDDRVGLIKKTRISSFPDGETFPFSYDEIANRYGRDILEKQAESIQLISVDQLGELNRLVELLQIPKEETDKWLKKAMADSFDELSTEIAETIINNLNKKIQGA